MKKLKFPLFAAVVVATRKVAATRIFTLAIAALMFAFASCDKKPVEPPVDTTVVDFESAVLDTKGVLLDTYTDKNLTFVNNYVEEHGYWYGFAISNHADTEIPGMDNQFSVWAGGGADGSKNFAVAYYSSWDGQTECLFPGDGFSPVSIRITNATYTALDIRRGSDFSEPFTDGDWYLVAMTGYDANDNETGSVDVYLADFRDGKSYLCDEWLNVDLTPLGKVSRMGFTCTASDTGTPTYFCIDNIAYRTPPVE